jgi:hypothetical protein
MTMTKETAIETIELQLKRKLFKEIRESVILWETNESSFDVIINNLGVFAMEANIHKECIDTIKNS